MCRCNSAGRRSRRTVSTASQAAEKAASGSPPSASMYRMPGRCAACATQPAGLGTEIPSPLSSQTNSSGSGRPWVTQYPAAFNAPAVVEWLIAASPNEQTVTASAGHLPATPSRFARLIARATPMRAGGARRWWTSAGSRRAMRHRRPCDARRTRRHACWPACCTGLTASRRPACVRPASRGRGRTLRSGSAAEPGRSAVGRRPRKHWTRARLSRSCRNPDRARASGGRGCRAAGCRPSRRTGPARRRRRSPSAQRCRGRPTLRGRADPGRHAGSVDRPYSLRDHALPREGPAIDRPQA